MFCYATKLLTDLRNCKFSECDLTNVSKYFPSWARPIRSDCNTLFFQFEIDGKKLYVGGRKLQHTRTRFGVRISVNSFAIDWMSDEGLFSSLGLLLIARLGIKFRAFFLSFYLSDDVKCGFGKPFDSNYMISKHPETNRLSAIGSELFL